MGAWDPPLKEFFPKVIKIPALIRSPSSPGWHGSEPRGKWGDEYDDSAGAAETDPYWIKEELPEEPRSAAPDSTWTKGRSRDQHEDDKASIGRQGFDRAGKA